MNQAKNWLQERFQKLGLALPNYSTTNDDQGWICTLTLCDGRIFQARGPSNKRSAEKEAAQYALQWLQQNPTAYLPKPLPLSFTVAPPPTPSPAPKVLDMETTGILVLIDLENVNDETSLMQLQNYERLGIQVKAIASGNYQGEHIARKYLQDVTILNTIVKEAADVHITFLVAKEIYCNSGKTKIVHILSRDHFAAAIPVIYGMLEKSRETVIHHHLNVQSLATALKS